MIRIRKDVVVVMHRLSHYGHVITHITYLTLVFSHSPYYPLAAGALGVAVVFGEVVARLVKEKERETEHEN